jgi:PKD repeat protein
MRKTFTLLAFICTAFASSVFAQTPAHRTCGTMEAEALLEKANPGYAVLKQQNEAEIARFLANPANRSKMSSTYSIPVVFHVVYRTAAENISVAQIMSQLDVLNKDFRKLNADTTLIPAAFKPASADTQIEFCLASIDPNGQPTTGITRTATTVTSFNTNNVVKSTAQGGKDAWPRDKYLNLWVCNLGSSLLGYAQFPGGPAATDGVVLLYTATGKYPANPFTSAAPYDKGRTATHEIGHWLNLRHIWGDDNGACTGDDQVTDTPLQKGENYGCPSYPLIFGTGGSCSSTGAGAMFMNYMDYTNDACMMMFTRGQRDRMVQALTVTRATLLTSNGCQNTAIANFSATPTSIPAGSATSFTDLSNGTPTSWSWSFPGGTPSTSTLQNPANILYSTPGTYNVTLTVTNAGGTNSRTVQNYITVTNGNCVSPTSSFTSSSASVCTGTVVTFNSSASTNANSYLWTFNGGSPATSTAANPSVTYNTPGVYDVSLRVTGGNCNIAVTQNTANAVTVKAIPAVTVSPAASISCTQSPVTLTATGATTYTWSPATGLSGTTGASVTANPATSTVYTVTGTTNGCSSPAYVSVQVTNVTANFTANPAIVNINPGTGLVSFTNTSSTTALFYSWNFGDPASGTANTSSVKNPTHTYTQPGSYTVTLISASGSSSGNCTNTKTFVIQVRNSTGLAEAFEAGSIKIYPNPAKNYLQVEVPESEKVTEVQLTNAIGQVITSQKPTAGQVRLNVSNFAGGIYFVKITNAQGSSITKKVSITQ